MRKLFGLLLMLPMLALAKGNGAWQASNIGVILSHRGQAMSSSVLAPSQPVDGLMTMVVWRYELNGPTPAGLNTRLCTQTRCIQLDAQSGTTLAFADVPAIEPLHFIWEVPGGGRLIPALNVRSIQVIVNYR